MSDGVDFSDLRQELVRKSPWSLAKEKVLAPRTGEGPEHHEWELVGTKSDPAYATTYFLWGCHKCGRRVVTETPSTEAPHFADQSTPDSKDLRRGGVDEDCRQAMVEGVHGL